MQECQLLYALSIFFFCTNKIIDVYIFHIIQCKNKVISHVNFDLTNLIDLTGEGSTLSKTALYILE